MENIAETIKLDNEVFKKYCETRMSIQKEFIKQYFGILTTLAYEGIEISNSQAFELLNKLHFDMYGMYKFVNFEFYLITRIRLMIILLKGRILFVLRRVWKTAPVMR